MAQYIDTKFYRNPDFWTVIGILSAIVVMVYAFILFANTMTKKQCDNVYPNPDIAGCGVYSQSDLDKKWCESNGGRLLNGGFGADNCVFPPQK